MLKENPPLLVWIGIILTITGLACLLFPVNKLENNVKSSVAGLVFALLSLLCTSLSMVIIKPYYYK
jgi:drug/metabolite transporter (DMT)-like permease